MGWLIRDADALIVHPPVEFDGKMVGLIGFGRTAVHDLLRNQRVIDNEKQ